MLERQSSCCQTCCKSTSYGRWTRSRNGLVSRHLMSDTMSPNISISKSHHALEGTCEWIFSHPDYCKWISDDEAAKTNKILWICAPCRIWQDSSVYKAHRAPYKSKVVPCCILLCLPTRPIWRRSERYSQILGSRRWHNWTPMFCNWF